MLKDVERQNAANPPSFDFTALWTRFQELAAASPKAELLAVATAIGAKLPPEERALLAAILAALLAPLDWPREWEQAREVLVKALDEMSLHLALATEDSLTASLGLQTEPLFVVAYTTLLSARFLLNGPCPRDELRVVARLCNVGTAGCLQALKKGLSALDPSANRESIQLARERFEVAWQKYASAARDMNAACGMVLFDGLDMRLEGV